MPVKLILVSVCRITVICTLIFMIFGCKSSTLDNELNPENLSNDSLYLIQKWALIGPFYLDGQKNLHDRITSDLLRKYGNGEEDILDYNFFLKFAKQIESLDSSKFLREFNTSYELVDLNNFIPVQPLSAAFVATNVYVTDDCVVGVNLSAYQSATVYLNGKRVYEIAWKKGRNFFREDFFVTRLKKGNNLIMVKISVSDPEYEPKKWMYELNLSTKSMSKKLYKNSYNRQFLRRSLISESEDLRAYCGPYTSDKLQYRIIHKQDRTEILKGEGHVDKLKGELVIPLSRLKKIDGMYTIYLSLDDDTISQDFFVGNIDATVDSLKNELKHLNINKIERILEFEGLFHRLYIDARRDSIVPDDQFEHWNRNRIPSLNQLIEAIKDAKKNVHNSYNFFLRYYHSNFYNGYYSYSVYQPKKEFTNKVPLFIHLVESSIPVRNWKDHYFNYMSRSINDAQNLSDENSFITLWTDCGGNIDISDQIRIFKEILNDVQDKYLIDEKKIFVVGNCATTNLALSIMSACPNDVSGAGLINPSVFDSPYFETSNIYGHKLSMVYAPYDEVIARDVPLRLYENLKMMDPKAKIFNYKYATHYNAPSDYTKKMHLDLLSR